MLSAFGGLRKGFVRQLAGLAGIILGTYCAYQLSLWLTNWWSGHFDINSNVMQIILFIILATIIFALVIWLSIMLDKMLKLALLGWINRLLGMLFGVLNIVVIFGALSYAIHSLKLSGIEFLGNDLAKSKVYNMLVSFADFMFPYINFILS